MDAAPPQIGGELSEVNRSQPLHHTMVGPLHHLGRRRLILCRATVNRGEKNLNMGSIELQEKPFNL